MRYAKLINGYPSYAPNPILHDGNYIGNPPGSVYVAEGYLPVVYTDPPGEPDAGYQWVEKWTETENAIVQGWKLVEIAAQAEEILDILMGGGE